MSSHASSTLWLWTSCTPKSIGLSLDYHDISWYFPIFYIFPHENNHLLGLILPARVGSSAVQVGHVGDSTAILGRLGANDQLIPVQLTRARQGTGEGVLGLAKQRDWSHLEPVFWKANGLRSANVKNRRWQSEPWFTIGSLHHFEKAIYI
jgi:hypothetical protein